MELQDALQAFLQQLAADGRSPHTIGQYRRHGAALAKWFATTGSSTDVASITPAALANFFAADTARSSCRGGTKKAVSLNAMRTSIRCFAKHLHDAGMVANNPARLLRRARCSPPLPRALRADEEARLLAVLAVATGPEAERDRMVVDLLLGTGVRLGSALALDVGDIDFEHSELSLRTVKNDRPCTVVLPATIAAKLKTFVTGRNGPLFMAGDRRVSLRHVQRRLRGWMEKAKISGRSAHSLRHSFACRIYSSTGDLQLTQVALGHASITSTVVYAKLDRTKLRAAVGA